MQDDATSQDHWAFERQMREREMALAERRLEHDMSSKGSAKAAWANPLVVAILAAAVAAGGNAMVSVVEGDLNRELETTKAEHARIQEMLETGDPDTAAENLRFLVEIGLISDEGMRARLTDFLDSRTPGAGPVLATANPEPVRKITKQDLLEMPMEPSVAEMAIRLSGVCPDMETQFLPMDIPDPLMLPEAPLGVWPERDCWTLFLAKYPEETLYVVQTNPALFKTWVAEGLPADWRAQAGME